MHPMGDGGWGVLRRRNQAKVGGSNFGEFPSKFLRAIVRHSNGCLFCNSFRRPKHPIGRIGYRIHIDSFFRNYILHPISYRIVYFVFIFDHVFEEILCTVVRLSVFHTIARVNKKPLKSVFGRKGLRKLYFRDNVQAGSRRMRQSVT
jgi:hypothetical protein